MDLFVNAAASLMFSGRTAKGAHPSKNPGQINAPEAGLLRD